MRDNRLRVGVDIDGVVADFVQRYREVCQTITGKELPTEAADWGMTNWGLTQEEHSVAWRTISETYNFHTSLLPYDEFVREGLGDFCREHRVFFITTRTTTKGLPTEAQTAFWLSTYCGVAHPTVLVEEQKGPLAKALGLNAMIDDKPENLVSVAEHSPETTLYLRDREWNQDAVQKIKRSFVRVLSFNEFKGALANGSV